MDTWTMPTPVGPFTVVVDTDTDTDAVVASGWTTDVGDLMPLIAPSLRPSQVRTRPDRGSITAAVTAYVDGDLAAIDDVAVVQRSGPFRQHAWDVLREVKPGAPVTYTEFAVRSGRPAAVRAAAGACAWNAAALFVPCHRVLRRDGTLGGFRWGLPVKRWLIEHEAR